MHGPRLDQELSLSVVWGRCVRTTNLTPEITFGLIGSNHSFIRLLRNLLLTVRPEFARPNCSVRAHDWWCSNYLSIHLTLVGGGNWLRIRLTRLGSLDLSLRLTILWICLATVLFCISVELLVAAATMSTYRTFTRLFYDLGKRYWLFG